VSIITKDFSRLLALLRKERKLSQKEVAEQLGISQALLSHYEKGIREPGLDFVVRAADYYQVTCDYLLGRDSDRGQINESEGEAIKANQFRGSVFPQLGKVLTQSSVSVLFDLMQAPEYRELATESQKYLSLCLYKLFRVFYESNPKNQAAFFALPAESAGLSADAGLALSEARMRRSAAELSKEDLPELSYDEILRRFPKDGMALLNLIKNAEKSLVRLESAN